MLRPGLVRFIAVAVAASVLASSASTAAATSRAPVHELAEITDAGEWQWPIRRFRVVEPYLQPAHRYGAGHRGLDLAPIDDTEVRSPAPGMVAFAGTVADRPLVTIDHGEGLVTTLEPVTARVEVGAVVSSGEIIGELAFGGHTAPGAVHFGVRYEGEYINPLVLLGGVPRAVLLPCCD